MSDDTWILNPEWEHAQFVSISELRECERKLEVLNRGNANAERILCELTGCESGRDVPDWIVKKNWELTDLAKAYLELVHNHTLAEERIKRLEAFVNRFLNPDDLGWAIGKFDRDEAREALGKERVESKAKEDKL